MLRLIFKKEKNGCTSDLALFTFFNKKFFHNAIKTIKKIPRYCIFYFFYNFAIEMQSKRIFIMNQIFKIFKKKP